MDTTTHDLKSAAHQLIDALPSGATWDDLMYRVYVRQCIDAGLDDANSGRVVDVDDVREQFGLER
jgi:predicted transcriptional regulator